MTAHSVLRAFRRRSGITQEELATRCGMSVRAIRDIENGRVVRPQVDTLDRIAAALDLGPADRDRLRNSWRSPEPRPAVLWLGVLGPLTVTVRGVDTPVTGRVVRTVLGLLAVSPNQPVGMDQLVAAVWPDEPPRTWETQVHTAISRLRRLLAATGSAIVRLPSGYLLRVGEDELDLLAFRATTRRAGALRATDRSGALEAYAAGVALWRGPVCAGDDGLRNHPSAVGAIRECTDAVLALADLAAQLGENERAVGALQRAAALEPYHEGLHQRLMVALAARGDRAGAARVFGELRRRLVDELGVEPARHVREVHQRVLRDDLPTAGASVVHPLAPALLPTDTGDFTGRHREVAELVAVVGSGQVATVSGMAGVGKTTLTLHVAHRVAHRYPDGQLYVDLRGNRPGSVEPAEVLGRFLRALGVDPQAVPQGAVEREDLYRSLLARRRLLLVLDNAADLAQVRPLLPGGGESAVIVTSRMRLSGLEGSHHIGLEVFDDEQAVGLLGRIASPRRVGAQLEAANEIVRLCGHLPLAVRIAAARLAARPTWPLVHMVAQLSQERSRLDRLALGDLAVRASLTLSYDSLGPSAARLLRRLALFDAADHPMWFVAVLAERPVDLALSDLDELVDAQLLIDSGIDANGQARYRLHDLVRLIAREQAEAVEPLPEQDRVVRVGFGAWLAVAETMARPVPGPCFAVLHGSAERTAVDRHAAGLSGVEPLRWFDQERVTLLSAIGQACAAGLDELAYDLAGCLEKYLDLRGMYGEWGSMNELVLGVCQAAGNVRGEAAMLRGLIDVRTWNPVEPTGNAMSRLTADAARLRQLFDSVGERAGASDAAVMSVWGRTAQGDVDGARTDAEDALRLAEEAGHVGGQARARVAVALVHRETGRVDRAVPELHEALRLTRVLGNSRYESTVQQFLGMAQLELGDLDAAGTALDLSLEIARRNGDRYVEALSLLMVARIQAARVDPAARATAALACDISRRYRMFQHLAHALSVLGNIELDHGRYAEAIACFEESEQIWRTRGWESFHEAVRADLRRARELAAAAGD